MPDFISDGVRLFYTTRGPLSADVKPVLLMHGFASNIDMNWIATRWLDDLANAGYHAIAFDHRGHGKSQKLYRPQDYGADLMAEDARRLLDHLGIARVHVIGYSMGARIAAFLAARHPERVDHLVMGGIGMAFVNGLPGTDDIVAALNAPNSDVVQTDVGRSFRAFALQTKSNLKALAACIRPVREAIPRDVLKSIACPVLVAVGTADTLAGSGRKLSELIPDAVAFDIPGRDHMKAVADSAFKKRVFEFLKK